MKKMNQNHRGEVCGVREPKPHLERNLANKDEHYWARKRGERPPVVGGSLVELEKKLASL